MASDNLSPRVREKLSSLHRNLLPFVDRLWARHFDPAVRAKHVATPEGVRELAERYTAHFGGTAQLALVELAHLGDLLSVGERDWLRRELGADDTTHRSTSPLPSWNANTGELQLGSKRLGKFRVMATASQPQLVLAAFQQAGWTEVIDNPLACSAEDLRKLIGYLNQHLDGIRLHTQAGGKEIRWSK